MDVQLLFGQNLKRCRTRQHMSRLELARRISVTASSVYNMETGLRFVSDTLLQRITDTLGILPEELFYTGTAADSAAIHAEVVKQVVATHLHLAARSLTAAIEP
jgi:transcriptional regulator with XRE-family HTH domain